MLVSLGIFLTDHIIRGLVGTTDVHAAELVQIPMELQDHTGLYRNIVMAFMDRGQYIPIARNFLFTAVSRCGFVLDQFLQPLIGGVDTLDPIGCLRT